MDNRAIGVFDSGLGGLTAVRELMRLLPHEHIVYFGDTGRVPYGTRSRDTILHYTRQDIRFLQQFDIKLVLIACGTASSATLPGLQQEFSLPILGVVEPACHEALQQTKNGKIGIIGTTGTIRSGSYESLLHSLKPNVETLAIPCPLFVPLVENGYIDCQVTRLVAQDYLTPLKEAGVDTLILGCTHYPLLRQVIGEIMGDQVTLIDAGATAAQAVSAYLSGQESCHTESTPSIRYFVSDDTEQFVRIGERFLQHPIHGAIQKIQIEQF